MADMKIPEFKHTSTEDIIKITDTLRATFQSNKTKDIEYRRLQLRKLYWALKDFTPLLCDALMKDMKKPKHEAILSEISWIINDCLYMLQNLDKFAKDDPVADVPVTFIFMKPRIRKEPLGVALIIGAYNFPLQLSITPLLGAIAAGCPAVLKPSEGAPHCAMAMKLVLESCLDPSAYAVINGAVPETTTLLNVKWDKILYTGNGQVGRIIAKKAAETLTPVILELGGLNPAFVTKNANLKLAARRIMWSKSLNAGQVCLSQNYVLVERSVMPAFIEQLRVTYKTFYPSGAKNSPDFARIINQRQFQRMKKMLDNTQGEIVVGGETDEDQLFIDLTAVLCNTIMDSCMKEESFGPIFALIAFDTLDEATNIANSVCRTPLALSIYGNDPESKKILNEVTSGGASINDGFFHASIDTVPFGGVGESGTGSYRGRASFDAFSHKRSIAETPNWIDKFIRVRYAPYSSAELARIQRMNGRKPNFDRNGNELRGLGYWVGFVLGLGSKGAKGALTRWVVVLAALYTLTLKRSSLGM